MCMYMDMGGGNYASKRKRKHVRRNTNADDSFLFSRSDVTKTKRTHEHKNKKIIKTKPSSMNASK